MRLIFLLNVFNEARTIRKAIESVHDIADEIRVYDGAYEPFPYEKPYSTDGTLDIAEEYSKVKIFRNTVAWKDQVTKRSIMFDGGQPGDFFFKLDGDEYIANPEIVRELLERDMDVYWVWTLSNVYSAPIMTARIFKYQEGLHYAGRHHWLFNGKKIFVTSDQNFNPRFKHLETPIRLFNLRNCRPDKRIDKKQIFLKERNKVELTHSREDRVYDIFARIVAHPKRAGIPRKPSTVLRYAENPLYSYTLLFSRPWAVDRYLANLKKMVIPKSTEAVVLIDSQDKTTIDKLLSHFKTDMRFCGVTSYVTNNPKLPEFAKVVMRRERIIGNWHILLTEAKGKYLLGGEDDSLPQADAYVKLIETLEREDADFVQANIIGRWAARICPAWQVKERGNTPDVVWNIKEKETGLDRIQGIGWYCFAAKADSFRKFPMRVDELMPLGPDVNLGYRMHKGGLKLLHNWDIKVEHFGEDFSFLPGRDPTEQKVWVRINSKNWAVKDFNPRLIRE